jgi:hypothetical protein
MSLIDDYKKEKFEREKAKFKAQGFNLSDSAEDVEIEPEKIEASNKQSQKPQRQNKEMRNKAISKNIHSSARKHRIPFKMHLPKL